MKTNTTLTPGLAAVGLGLAAICCLCVFGAFGIGLLQLRPNLAQTAITPTARFTQSSAPTSAPATLTPFLIASATPSLQLAQTATARAAWPSVISDTFSTSNPNDWSMGDLEGEFANLQRTLDDGVYRWQVQTKSEVFVRANNSLPRVDDFYFAVDVRQISGPLATNYGVVFRQRDDANLYYFGVQEVGRCDLIRLDNDETITLLQAFCGSVVRPGHTNRLAISAEGAHLLFYINGQLVGEVEDDTLTAGVLTLAVAIAEANQTAVLEFDNVELRAP